MTSPRGTPKQPSVRISAAALAVAAVLACGSFLGGCSAEKKMGGLFGGGESSESAEGGAGQRYYAAASGQTVYSEAASSSKVVGKLSAHERVTRYKVTRGYAYVKADASGLEGWVNNSILLWRVPAATPAKPAHDEPAEPAVEAAPAEAAEAPAAPESPEPAPPAAEKPPKTRRTGASIFDPY